MSEHQVDVTPLGQRTIEERQALLGGQIREHVARGYRVESQVNDQAVLVKGHRPNHLLHLILSLLTLGLWMLFVWLPVVVFGGERRRVVTVDSFGNVQISKG